jgi:predicted esterase
MPMKYWTAGPLRWTRVALQKGDSGARRKAAARPGTFWLLLAYSIVLVACGHVPPKEALPQIAIEPLSFQIASGEDRYQIEGYFAHTSEMGRMPALLVLNGDDGDARHCILRILQFASLRIRLACISLPGYGKSSGPSRYVGPQSIEAARRGLDLVAARPDVDSSRIAIWGISEGAVAAGLLMDSDERAHAVILQSGAYDLLQLWPRAPIGTKLSILRQVWPSRRLLQERSVIENMPARLDRNVLILHGEQDSKTPVVQAKQLAEVLNQRGAHVEAHFFADGAHRLGPKVDELLRNFLQANLAPPSEG